MTTPIQALKDLLATAESVIEGSSVQQAREVLAEYERFKKKIPPSWSQTAPPPGISVLCMLRMEVVWTAYLRLRHGDENGALLLQAVAERIAEFIDGEK